MKKVDKTIIHITEKELTEIILIHLNKKYINTTIIDKTVELRYKESGKGRVHINSLEVEVTTPLTTMEPFPQEGR